MEIWVLKQAWESQNGNHNLNTTHCAAHKPSLQGQRLVSFLSCASLKGSSGPWNKTSGGMALKPMVYPGTMGLLCFVELLDRTRFLSHHMAYAGCILLILLSLSIHIMHIFFWRKFSVISVKCSTTSPTSSQKPKSQVLGVFSYPMVLTSSEV
jgi:hypothetical protein